MRTAVHLGPIAGSRALLLTLTTGLVSAGLLAVGVTSASAVGTCTLAAGTTTCAYSTTGIDDSFTVPAGVTQIQVSATGAGGANRSGSGAGNSFQVAAGATVKTVLSVTPNAVLTVRVGATGSGSSGGTSGAQNSGGAGGQANTFSIGGGGGGASALLLGDGTRLVVAAGGGGTGYGPSRGGDAGPSAPSSQPAGAVFSGSGGTTRGAPCTGGGGGGTTPGVAGTSCGSTQAATAGTVAGMGGNGAVAAGGGGGGWTGGGGGGGGGTGSTTNGGGGAGGSYSSAAYTVSSASNPAANGSILISYPPDQAPSLSGHAPNGNYNTPYSFTYIVGGHPNPSVTHTGTLPPGLVLSTSGQLSGTPTAAGSYSFTLMASNGIGSNAVLNDTVVINPAVLTVTGPSPTIAYGQPIPALTPTYSGFVNGDTKASLTTKPTCITTATSTSAPGTYPVTCSGAVDPNYTYTYKPGTLTITKASQTITFVGPSSPVTYGVAPITLSASAPGGPVTFTVSGPCTVSGSTLTVTGAGSCVITAHQGGNANYTAARDVSRTLVINPAVLTVTGPSPTIAYGQPIPALTPTYSGFVNGDTAASLTTKPTCTTAATSTSAPGTYPVTCSGAVDPNYTYSYKPGTLTITKAATTTTLTVTPNPPAVNQATTLTATVHHTGSGAAPTGTVSFYDGATLLGTVPVQADGTATLITSFGGGPRSITAVYSGDSNYLSSSSTPPTLVDVHCDVTITGTHAALTVTSGTTCLINATITGGISVARGAVLDVENSTVNGSISAGSPAGLRICGSHTGSIAVTGATGYVRIGDPTNNCQPNTITGGLTAAGGHAGGTISDNTITGSWTIANNTPPFTVTGNHH